MTNGEVHIYFCVATKVYHGIPFVSTQKKESDNLYEKFAKLVETKGVSVHQVAKATEIPYSCLTDWKAGRSTPKMDKIIKLAEYFEVPLEYFVR